MNKYPKTSKAIMDAFAGESQARNKYDFYAKVARKEGHQRLADFFEETAKNEQEHAKLLLKLVKGISNTKDNLQSAIDGEHYEQTSMYPEFSKIAQEEGFAQAQTLFDKLAKIEKHHDERFERLLKELNENTLYDSKTQEKIIWICKKCGNIEEAVNPPQVCPVCNHPQGYFEREQKEY